LTLGDGWDGFLLKGCIRALPRARTHTYVPLARIRPIRPRVWEMVDFLTFLPRKEFRWSTANSTLFAVFGVSSPQGRFADKMTYLNPPYRMWIEDIAYDRGVYIPRSPHLLPLADRPRSARADAIIANGLIRHNGRKVPMTDAARAALVDYYAETIELLLTNGDFIARVKPRDWRRYCSAIERHRRGCSAVLVTLNSPQEPKGDNHWPTSTAAAGMTTCIDFPQTRAAMAAFEPAFKATQGIGWTSRDRPEWLSWRQAHDAERDAEAVVVAAYADEMLPTILGGRWRKTDSAITVAGGGRLGSVEWPYSQHHILFDHHLHFRLVGAKCPTTWRNAVIFGRPYNHILDVECLASEQAARHAQHLAERFGVGVWVRENLSAWFPGSTALVIAGRGLSADRAPQFGFRALAAPE
jgi:hypothetical protein